jgi:hypothetical protein
MIPRFMGNEVLKLGQIKLIRSLDCSYIRMVGFYTIEGSEQAMRVG